METAHEIEAALFGYLNGKRERDSAGYCGIPVRKTTVRLRERNPGRRSIRDTPELHSPFTSYCFKSESGSKPAVVPLPPS